MELNLQFFGGRGSTGGRSGGGGKSSGEQGILEILNRYMKA